MRGLLLKRSPVRHTTAPRWLTLCDRNAFVSGVVFDSTLALTIAGTAVALFPILKRQNERFALGYVGLHTLEAGIIAIGVIPSWLS
jgi:hypothetical protein